MIYMLLLVPGRIYVDAERVWIGYWRHYGRYERILTQRKSTRKSTDGLIKSPLPAGSAAILGVCSQIHDEAERILYKSNKFVFHDNVIDDLPLFLLSISLNAYTLLTKLEIKIAEGTKSDSQYMDLLLGCRGLKDLTLVDVGKIRKFQLSLLKGLRLRSISITPPREDTSTSQLFETVLSDAPLRGNLLKWSRESRDAKVSSTTLSKD